MKAKEIHNLLKQLATGEEIANPKKAGFIQDKLRQDTDLRALLDQYKEAFKNNELHLLDADKSFNRIENQALIEALKAGNADTSSKNKAAAKLLTNQDFRSRYEATFPKTEEPTRVISLRKVMKYSLRIAATLTLLIAAWWFTGQALVYNEAMTAFEEFEKSQNTGNAVQLGVENQLSGTVCDIVEKFDHAVEKKDFIYVPEGGVRVVETGSKFGVKFFVVKENNCEITVLVKTNVKLPEVGERVSFDARAFEVSALGMSLKVLVEEQRHVVY